MKKRILFLAIMSLFALPMMSQGRAFIKEKMKENGNCRNVAITRTNGDLMLYGRNGWAGSGLPTGLSNALNKLNDKGEYIDDVQLTEEGRWLILWGNNGFEWNDIPYSLEKKLREYNERNDVVTSVTFNDDGDWIIISQDYYSSSDSRITEWLKAGAEKLGTLWAACVTEDAIVAVYSGGYTYFGNVPQSLKKKLGSTSMDVFRLKIAGMSWFIADKQGRYDYYM